MMSLSLQDLTPEEQAECIHIVESVKMKANYGKLIFSTLLGLNGGMALIEDAIVRYERDNLIGRFNILFDSLLQNAQVLQYSDEEWIAFYYEFIKDIDLNAYVELFDKGLFARSFAAEMYSYHAPAFDSLSKEERDYYLTLQTKFAPIPLEGLLIASQIIDQLLSLDKHYGDSHSLIRYYKNEN